jgi:hypothetical protein
MAFTFRLEHEDGTPADPPVLHTAVPDWSVGDTIPLGANRPSLRVIETRFASGGAGASREARLAGSSPPLLAL